MPQFLIAVYDQADTRDQTMAEMAPVHAAVDAVNQAAIAEGIFVLAGGLHDQTMRTSVDARSGTTVVTEGAYLDADEYVGGFWIINVADPAAALEWTKRFAEACQQPLELRPFMEDAPEGAVG